MSDTQQPISTERALELLTKRVRRQILRQVADTPGVTTVDQLKSQLDAVDSMSLGGKSSKHRGTELHHVHLPKLRAADVIEYEATPGTVRKGRQFQEVLSLLEVIDDHWEDTSPTIS